MTVTWPTGHAQASNRSAISTTGTRHGLSPRSETFMEQPAAPPFIMPD
ncbi:hypothetical protein LMG28727_03625 [Paraburkholderia kirstenboschensis]|nr:hypothetical protein LMG28727_03625 [Paraburkholderia kirstenboschensis]